MRIFFVTMFVSIGVLVCAQDGPPTVKGWELYNPQHLGSSNSSGTAPITYHGGPVMGDSFPGDSPINIYYIW